jgi:hypothetical protein
MIRSLPKNTDYSEDDVKELIQLAWEAGYDFRRQEEELNKGASY